MKLKVLILVLSLIFGVNSFPVDYYDYNLSRSPIGHSPGEDTNFDRDERALSRSSASYVPPGYDTKEVDDGWYVPSDEDGGSKYELVKPKGDRKYYGEGFDLKDGNSKYELLKPKENDRYYGEGFDLSKSSVDNVPQGFGVDKAGGYGEDNGVPKDEPLGNVGGQDFDLSRSPVGYVPSEYDRKESVPSVYNDVSKDEVMKPMETVQHVPKVNDEQYIPGVYQGVAKHDLIKPFKDPKFGYMPSDYHDFDSTYEEKRSLIKPKPRKYFYNPNLKRETNPSDHPMFGIPMINKFGVPAGTTEEETTDENDLINKFGIDRNDNPLAFKPVETTQDERPFEEPINNNDLSKTPEKVMPTQVFSKTLPNDSDQPIDDGLVSDLDSSSNENVPFYGNNIGKLPDGMGTFMYENRVDETKDQAMDGEDSLDGNQLDNNPEMMPPDYKSWKDRVRHFGRRVHENIGKFGEKLESGSEKFLKFLREFLPVIKNYASVVKDVRK